MKHKLFHLAGVILIISGSIFIMLPEISSWIFHIKSEQTINNLKKRTQGQKELDALYQKAYQYNQKIYRQKQRGLKDIKSYETAQMILPYNKTVFGYITISKIKEKLPLYLGADKENLKKGAAILGQTSLPIGNKNSNSVIAAHRGYQGIPYFREIDKLNRGDEIFITNPWEKLRYIVFDIEIIKPYEFDKIKIQKDKEMVTLLTCHPYRGNGKYRYAVYCIRKQGKTKEK